VILYFSTKRKAKLVLIPSNAHRKLIKKMTAPEPDQRPTAAELLLELEKSNTILPLSPTGALVNTKIVTAPKSMDSLNDISRLQELCDQNSTPKPKYTYSNSGGDHNPSFSVCSSH